jgi:hypothetical protein
MALHLLEWKYLLCEAPLIYTCVYPGGDSATRTYPVKERTCVATEYIFHSYSQAEACY